MVEYEESSGNVFRDIGFSESESLELEAKSRLTFIIKSAIEKARWTQCEAAKRMGLTQPRLSRLLRGDFTNISEAKLFECIVRLGYDVTISVASRRKPRRGSVVGRLEIVEA